MPGTGKRLLHSLHVMRRPVMTDDHKERREQVKAGSRRSRFTVAENFRKPAFRAGADVGTP